MGTDNLFHKKKRALDRKLALRLAKPRILIVCEGIKTEPNYFKSFRIVSADVQVIGTSCNTKSLVNYAKKKEKEAQAEKVPYDQIWCVFDKDCFSDDQFNTAVQMARQQGFKVAYSNEAFELWYVLHFEYLQIATDRNRYNNKLTKYLKRKYRKNDSNMYNDLLYRQSAAINNAHKLQNIYLGRTPADSNPLTTVHLLVKELNKILS